MIKAVKVLAWSVIAFCYLPILVLFVNSFNVSRSGESWDGFTLHWYYELFRDQSILSSAKTSILIALIASFFSTVLGTMSALAVRFGKLKIFQKFHESILGALFVIPDIQMGICMMLSFIYTRCTFGLVTICIAHSTFCIVYVFSIVSTRLNQINMAVIEAATDLGANRFVIFCKIILPACISTILAASIFAFTASVDDFIISFFVSGIGNKTLPLEAYGIIKMGSPPILDCISAIMILCTYLTSRVFTKIMFEKQKK